MKKIRLLSVAVALSTAVLMAGTEGSSSTYYGTDAGPAGDDGSTIDAQNTFVGVNAGISQNNDGLANTYIGWSAGADDKDGVVNTFIGYRAGLSSISGIATTIIGAEAGLNTTDGFGNTFVGYAAGLNVWSNNGSNTMIGAFAGENSYYNNNTMVGYAAGSFNENGINSVMIGAWAGYNSLVGLNLYVGTSSGYSNTSGSGNTFLGNRSGYGNISGEKNTFIGTDSGNQADVNGSVFMGNEAGYNATRDNTLYISNSDTESPLIYGEFDNDLVKINGSFVVDGTVTATDVVKSSFNGDDSANNHNMLALDANNIDGASDVGFSLENKESNFKWTFRTYNPVEGFAASKIGTGGTEFEVGNTGTDLSTTVVKMGGVVVFKDGHLVNKSGDELASLVQEQNVKLAAQDKLLAETMAKMEAKNIETQSSLKAKDAEIIAMKTEISDLKIMKQKVAMMESILTNLALDTSSVPKDKVSLNTK